jgi:hypothetical protein
VTIFMDCSPTVILKYVSQLLEFVQVYPIRKVTASV